MEGESVMANPYRPGAGTAPVYFAGRSHELCEAERALQEVRAGAARSILYYGLRGAGKTVLLNMLENMAERMELPSEYIEADEKEAGFRTQLVQAVYRLLHRLDLRQSSPVIQRGFAVWKAFADAQHKAEPGRETPGSDMTGLLLALGQAAQAAECGAVLFVDEIQYCGAEDLEALMTALHRVNQKGYPLLLIAVGLPKIVAMAGELRAYAERLFAFIEVGALKDAEARLALLEPARSLGVTYTDGAVEEILLVAQGYPYFLQEYGKWVWDLREGQPVISKRIVERAYRSFEQSLDEAFFAVRHERATPREVDFMEAMAKCRFLPCTTKEVAAAMGKSVQGISPLRADLIAKGFIYAATRGRVGFSVPQFDRYLQRIRSKQN